jgi:spermidine/putrescine transport system substrate-binding protein
MKRHPREGAKSLRLGLERQLGRPLSRREFIRASAGAALTVPTLSAILAACDSSNPRESIAAQTAEVASPDNPVTLPLNGTPIADGLEPETGATLQIFNWDQYIWRRVVSDFCEEYNCDYEITPFNNTEEMAAKMQTGQLKFDVLFPTYDYLHLLVAKNLVQPLNHTYIPNLEANTWDFFHNPFYDQGWQYSVPYVVYSTGVAYRRDEITDEQIDANPNPRALLWDPAYQGRVGVYDSYRDTIAFALQKEGINNVNTEDPAEIDIAKQALLDLIPQDVRVEINGVYARLPKGDYSVHEAWSGDIVAGWGYVTKYVEEEYQNLGYWFPEDGSGPIDNDLIAIPTNAENPVLAHKFLNFMLDYPHAMDNFSWNGYQPPQKQADVSALTTTEGLYSQISNWAEPAMLVPPWMPDAVVTEQELVGSSLRLLELPIEADTLWQDAWQEFKSGS